jgi:hypothetical protein
MNHPIEQNEDGITIITPNKLFACPLAFFSVQHVFLCRILIVPFNI